MSLIAWFFTVGALLVVDEGLTPFFNTEYRNVRKTTLVGTAFIVIALCLLISYAGGYYEPNLA